jgi:hypothetical protein
MQLQARETKAETRQELAQNLKATARSASKVISSHLGTDIDTNIELPTAVNAHPNTEYQHVSKQLLQAVQNEEQEAVLKRYQEELAAAKKEDKNALQSEFAQAWAQRIRTKQAQAAALAKRGKANMKASAITTGVGATGAVIGTGLLTGAGISAYKTNQAKYRATGLTWRERAELAKLKKMAKENVNKAGTKSEEKKQEVGSSASNEINPQPHYRPQPVYPQDQPLQYFPEIKDPAKDLVIDENQQASPSGEENVDQLNSNGLIEEGIDPLGLNDSYLAPYQSNNINTSSIYVSQPFDSTYNVRPTDQLNSTQIEQNLNDPIFTKPSIVIKKSTNNLSEKEQDRLGELSSKRLERKHEIQDEYDQLWNKDMANELKSGPVEKRRTAKIAANKYIQEITNDNLRKQDATRPAELGAAAVGTVALVGGGITAAGGAIGMAHASSQLKTAEKLLSQVRSEIAAGEALGLFSNDAKQETVAQVQAMEQLLDETQQAIAVELKKESLATQAPAQTPVTVSTPTKTIVASTKTTAKIARQHVALHAPVQKAKQRARKLVKSRKA